MRVCVWWDLVDLADDHAEDGDSRLEKWLVGSGVLVVCPGRVCGRCVTGLLLWRDECVVKPGPWPGMGSLPCWRGGIARRPVACDAEEGKGAWSSPHTTARGPCYYAQ